MLKGKKILVVEDSRTIMRELKIILENEGAVMAEAGSEWGMFNKIDEYGVIADLIIMDLVLNHDDGLDLISKLKEHPLYGNIPVLILTEKAEINTIMKAKDLGVKGYLRKPFEKKELVGRISSILDVDSSQ